jgi:putative NADH-flavin reductase
MQPWSEKGSPLRNGDRVKEAYLYPNLDAVYAPGGIGTQYFQRVDTQQLQKESPMKIALVGATGNVGIRLISELTRRGHHVTAIARHPEKLQGRASVSPVSGDVQNENALAAMLAGHDVVIHSVKFLSTNAPKIIAATKMAKVPRLLVVGGAGSLEVSPGLILVNSPDFPAEYKPEALAGVEFLNVLRKEKELDWTFLSPSYFFAPGERTGKFRLGKDQLLVAADGQSRISTEDFAIALVDELEQPKHARQRFTVGY